MNRQILGDKRKSSFDEGLADIVNAKFDEEERLEKLKKEKNGTNSVSDNSSPNKIILPGKNKTASEWLKYAENNNLNLASVVDFYEIAKKYGANERASSIKVNEYGIPSVLLYDEELAKQAGVLRKDLKENGLITSTVIDYQGMHDVRRNVKAFQDFDPNYVFFTGVMIHEEGPGFAPLKFLNKKIPILGEGVTLKEIKEKYKFAQAFLRDLFCANDNFETITKNLCSFTQLPETRIKIYTLGRRHIVRAREVVIKYENNNLLILCDRNGLKGKAWRAE